MHIPNIHESIYEKSWVYQVIPKISQYGLSNHYSTSSYKYRKAKIKTMLVYSFMVKKKGLVGWNFFLLLFLKVN